MRTEGDESRLLRTLVRYAGNSETDADLDDDNGVH